MRRTTQRAVGRPSRRADGGDPGDPPVDKFTQHCLRFHACQRSSDTHVCAISEADMHARVAVCAVFVRFVEDERVAVVRTERQQLAGAGGNGDLADLVVRARVAVEVLDRAGDAHLFLDGDGDEVRVGADEIVLVGVLGQRVEHAAE